MRSSKSNRSCPVGSISCVRHHRPRHPALPAFHNLRHHWQRTQSPLLISTRQDSVCCDWSRPRPVLSLSPSNRSTPRIRPRLPTLLPIHNLPHHYTQPLSSHTTFLR